MLVPPTPGRAPSSFSKLKRKIPPKVRAGFWQKVYGTLDVPPPPGPPPAPTLVKSECCKKSKPKPKTLTQFEIIDLTNLIEKDKLKMKQQLTTGLGIVYSDVLT